MNIFAKFGCRTVQFVFRLAQPILPYREPELLDSVESVPALMQKKKRTSVLLVTDRGLRSSGVTQVLEQQLVSSGIRVAVYDGTNANPTVDNVEAAVKMYHHCGCEAIIAFGGGSSMDCAKAVGARIAYPKRTLGQMKGLLRVWRRLPDIVAIPTTAGTGSEVTVTAVITDPKQQHKYTMNNFTMIPHYAVLDPRVTYTLPAHLTATTGMDALTHSVEAYIGGSTNPRTRKLALDSVKLIFKNIEIAYTDGRNHTARANMLRAAYQAGIAFSVSYVGYIHAVAHSLGGRYNIPHGLANAVLMPVVLEHYGSAVHKKLHELAIAAGVSDAGQTHQQGAESFIRAIRSLNERMAIPATLPGINPEDIPAMAKHASKEANPLYPVPVLMDARELAIFYRKVSDWRY